MTLRTLDRGGTVQDSDGRTLVFLANSGQEMRCVGQSVDMKSLKVPLQGGDLKTLDALTDSDIISVPLLLDHNPSVNAMAGSITRLELTGEGLVATARLADNDNGNLVKELAADGMLHNNFSISIDYPDQSGSIIRNAELLEISVVYAGADQRTKVMKHYAREQEEPMSVGKYALTDEERDQLNQTIQDALQSALDDITAGVDEVSDTEAEDTDTEEPEEDSTETPQSPRQSNNARNTPMNVFVTTPSTARQNVKTSQRTDWLETKDAVAEYERTLIDNDGRGIKAFKRAWADVARKHSDYASSISEDDVEQLIPKPVITEIQDVYNTADEIWPLLNKLGMDQYTVGQNSVGLKESDGTGRAHGYPVSSYGTQKTDETIKLVSRTLTADYIYKRVTLNKGDIRRTQRPGALVNYVVRELGNRIFQTIGYSTIFDDFTDMSMFRSIETDAADSSSDWAGNLFALTMEEGTYSNLLFDFKMAAARVKAAGEKVLVCNSTTAAEMSITTNANGTPLLPLSNDDLARVIGVSRIITPTWWEDDNDETMLGVVFVPSKYGVVGDTSIEAFTDFSLDTNENVWLQEIFAGGGLMEEKSACIVTPSAQS